MQTTKSQVISSNRSDSIESFKVIGKIGKGKFSVYHVYSFKKKVSYALKLFPKTSQGVKHYQKEKLMLRLSHPNVIRYNSYEYQHDDFHCLLMEFGQYGNFFEFIAKGFLDNEVLIRTYFHQLIEGLEYLHSQGVAHLDLKLDNLVLSSNFMLKIIDFDQAQPISSKEVKSGGTVGYRAPEIINEECCDPSAADVYSAGIILFTFKAREYPFIEKEDPLNQNIICYSTFVNNNALFWKVRARIKKDKDFFSADFIELVNGMLHYDPKKRWKIKDIKKSSWYNGTLMNNDLLKVQMKEKWDKMNMKQTRSKTPVK